MANLLINSSKTSHHSLLLIFLGLLLLNYSCSSSERIPVELEQRLRAGGVQDINLDFTYQSPDVPDKKYMAITVTYNFSTADGTLQKEYRGFILKLENGSWKTDHNTSYTKSSEKAKSLLEGKK